jgi:hypothetical protein
MERVEGIEPSYEVWKTPALPLSYTRTEIGAGRGNRTLTPTLATLWATTTPYPRYGHKYTGVWKNVKHRAIFYYGVDNPLCFCIIKQYETRALYDIRLLL